MNPLSRIDYPRSDRDGWRRYVPSWRQWALLVATGAVVLIAAFAVVYVTVDVPEASELATAETTTFTYADGSELGRDGATNRQIVDLNEIPVVVRHAVLAAEDRNFYSEPGISPTGIARALWVDLRGGDVSQGGSTITQQYAKNAYLTSERTVTRKIKEIVIALKLSRERAKDEILRDYLNTIYFGRGAYGIEAAAQAYFGEPASQLRTGQAALLAAVIRAPSFYDPIARPKVVEPRWHYVLDGMVDEGWLTREKADSLKFTPRGLRQSGGGSSLSGPNGYIIRAAEAEMVRHGFSDNQINLGGMKVTLTVSKNAQHAAVDAVDTVLEDAPKDLRPSLVAVEPGTGRIRAMYGGSDYQKRQFNDAMQGRIQPGSSFKPYVLAAALDDGIGLRSAYSGRSPQTFAGESFENFGDEQFGSIDLVTATAHSVNTVFVPLGIDAGGPDAVAETAEKAGITTDLAPDEAGASLFLGGLVNGVRPVDQADAYATFAAEGRHAPPYLVQKVTDRDGKVLYQAHPHADDAFDEDVMADTTYALQAPIREGTATAAALAGGRPAAGKTGTTTDNVSAWFVGYTPQLSTAVALHRDDNKPLQDILGYGEVTGGTLPALVWKAFMDGALAGEPVESFPTPAFVGEPEHPRGPTSTPTSTATPTTTPTSRPTGRPTVRPTVRPTFGPSPTSTAHPTATATPGQHQQGGGATGPPGG